MVVLSVFGTQRQWPPSTRVLIALLAFVAEICGCRLFDQNPVALWPTGPHLGFWLPTTESLLHLPPLHPLEISVSLSYGNYGSAGNVNLNLRLFSGSPAATVSCCVCAPCCGGGHLKVDLVLESQTVRHEESTGTQPLVSSSLI